MTQHTTKTQAAYSVLRRAILQGDLGPGERLVISNWTKLLDMSKLPVREALSRLRTEGLVTIKPHTGVFVSDISRSDLYEIMSMRRELEALAARHAAPHVDESCLATLADINNQMRRAADDGASQTFAEMNKKFHLTLYSRCSMVRLQRVIDDLWSVSDRYRMRMVFSRAPDRMQRACVEHDMIVEALGTGNTARVQCLIYEHKTAALNAMLSRLDLPGDMAQR